MGKILIIVKIVVLIQFFIIAAFVLGMYIVKLFTHTLDKKKIANKQWVYDLLSSRIESCEPLSLEPVPRLQRLVHEVLIILKEMEYACQDSEQLILLKQELSELVLKPMARKLSFSRNWFQRYIAALCYGYGFASEDEEAILQLLKDDTLLVSINAAAAVVKFYNPMLINAMIDAYAKARRLRQSAFAEIVSRGHPEISVILLERLKQEEDLYTKVFCYRLLCRLPQETMNPCVKRDLSSDSTDLRVVVIQYLGHCGVCEKEHWIIPLAEDPHWQVRAAVAKALGHVQGEKSISALASLIQDSEKWVRINAAQALKQLGENGVAVLRAQSPLKDKFAYETAQTVLITMENT